jgi:hypothetical protein
MAPIGPRGLPLDVDMTYFYNSSTGGFANESPPAPQYFTYEVQLRLGQGWHAYGTIAQMQAAIKANNWPPPDASKGLLSGSSTLPSTPSRAANAGLGDIIGNVNASNILVRVGEILLGIVLIGVGIAKLTGTANIISTAAKVAV